MFIELSKQKTLINTDFIQQIYPNERITNSTYIEFQNGSEKLIQISYDEFMKILSQGLKYKIEVYKIGE